VKKRRIVILCLFATGIIISHDLLPHHHADIDDPEIFCCNSTEHDDSSSGPDCKQSNQFPPHRHGFSDEDFLVQRSSVSLSRVLDEFHKDSSAADFASIEPETDLMPVGPVYILKEELSFIPAFLTCNFTRGSPYIS
jgi:hypothetical protein